MNDTTIFPTSSLTTMENTTRGYNSTERVIRRELTPMHIACIFIIVAGITINSVVIYLFLTKRYLQNSLSNIFLFSLAISDLCYSAMAIPSYIHCEVTGSIACSAYEIILVLFSYSTVYHILIAITEKLFAICFTIKHRSLFTQSLAIKLSVSVWIVALIIALLPLTWRRSKDMPSEQFYAFHFATAFVAPVIISAIMYTAMAYKLSKQFSKMSTFRASTNNQHKKRLRNERKAVLMFAIMFFAFLFCWGGWFAGRFKPITNEQLNLFFNITKYLDPIINPLVHTFVKRDFHQALGINERDEATKRNPNLMHPLHLSRNDRKKMADVNEHVTSL